MATSMSILRKRLQQFDKMKASQQKYNKRRWQEMKEALALRDLLEAETEAQTSEEVKES